MLTTIRHLLKNGLIFYLVLCSLLLGFFTSDSMAILIPSVLPGAQGSSVTHRQSELERIQVLLESKLISQRLSDLGLTVDEIQARLAQLTDDKIHQIAQRLDSLLIGGDALGIVIALLVVAILVVIFLQITGHKIIVTK
ncbi:MAG TPA: PA2779 family protein [Nitrospiria bacterium]|nr:PA2779 family protein [Nitrospiria bacterium]